MSEEYTEHLDLESPIEEEVSPYDYSYPLILLLNGIKKELRHATIVAQEMYNAVAKTAPEIAQIQQSMKKGYRYIVDATDSTLEAIESGRIKLTTAKSGKIFAQIRNANGQYGSKLPIKKELFRKGIDPVQMANSLQMRALQDQVQSIADQLLLIDQSVRAVLQGQQNDRIGLYYSGVALYLEANTVENKEMQRSLICQSLRALADASFQLTLTMQSDIKYLADKGYEASRGKRAERIKERMNNISRSFAFVHQAALMRAAVYCEQGELAAMTSVLDEYSLFIENTVAKNAPLLVQCDKYDAGTETSGWKAKARLNLDVSQLKSQLKISDMTIYLRLEGGEN